MQQQLQRDPATNACWHGPIAHWLETGKDAWLTAMPTGYHPRAQPIGARQLADRIRSHDFPLYITRDRDTAKR